MFMKPIEKGAYGYIDAHKKRQLLKTIIFFLLPIAIFVTGFLTTKTKENYFTIVAVVGCLPACKELVNVLMFWKRRSMPQKLYQEISAHAGELMAAYELLLTTYEATYPILAVVISRNHVAGYTEVSDRNLKKAEDYIRTVLKDNGISGIQVCLHRELNAFLECVDGMKAKGEATQEATASFEEDERYPGFSKEQMAREILLALSM